MAAHLDGLLAIRHAPAGVLHHGKRLGQDFIQRRLHRRVILDRREPRLPVSGFLTQGVIGKRLQSGLDLVDTRDHGAKLFDFAVVL